jgi:hypothetical protein
VAAALALAPFSVLVSAPAHAGDCDKVASDPVRYQLCVAFGNEESTPEPCEKGTEPIQIFDGTWQCAPVCTSGPNTFRPECEE